MNTKSERGQALIVTIILLAIIIAGFLIVMDGVGHGLSLSIMPNSPTYACIYDSGLSPVQDGTYPPEGYHCRLYAGDGASEPVNKVKGEKETDVIEAAVIVPAADNPVVEDKPSVPEKGNNGHGNNVDGVDSSNPGHGPKNSSDPSSPVDDEKGKP